MMDATDFTPGRHDGIDNDRYHAGPGISKSHLDEINRSPLHYWASYIDPDREPEEKTPALILGSAIDVACLEPDLLPSLYVSVPEDAPKRPSSTQRSAKKPSQDSLDAMAWWDDFNAKHGGKTVLSTTDFRMVMAVRDRIYSHPLAKNLVTKGRKQSSYFAIDSHTGLLIKCKPDNVMEEEIIVDLKSTENASPDAFARSVINYRYDVQAAWYNGVVKKVDGVEPKQFVFVPIEKKWPHAIGVYFTPSEVMLRGQRIARRDLDLLADCLERNHWPDYAEQPQPLVLPKWALTFDN